jgi:hypothetical protein
VILLYFCCTFVFVVIEFVTGFVGGGGVGSGTLVSLSTLVYTPHRKLLADSGKFFVPFFL